MGVGHLLTTDPAAERELAPLPFLGRADVIVHEPPPARAIADAVDAFNWQP
jgi:hypothetical protein